MASPLDLFGFHVNVSKFFGIFEIESESKMLKSLMEFHTIGYQILVTYPALILFPLSILDSPSLKQTLQIMFIVSAYVNASFKTFSVYTKRKRLRELWSKLDHPDFVANDHFEMRLFEVMKFNVHKVINVFSWFGVINLIVVCMAPMMEWKKRLPSPIYFPFGFAETNVGFYFAYLYECLIAVYAGISNIAINMYLFDLFVSIEFLLLLLSSRLSRLGYASGCNEPFNSTSYSRKSFYREICQYVEFHLKINGIVCEMNALVNDLIFIQVIQTVFVLADSLILLIAYDLTIAEFIVPVFWLITFLAETFIYCYFGSNISYAFDSVHHSIYSSNFIAFDRNTNLAMLKMLTVTGARQIKISAVGFVRYELSLNQLLMILKTTYSTVMLLKSM